MSEDYVTLYRQAFEEFRAVALWDVLEVAVAGENGQGNDPPGEAAGSESVEVVTRQDPGGAQRAFGVPDPGEAAAGDLP